MLLCASASILVSLDKPFKEFIKECDSPQAILYPYSEEDKDVVALGEQFAELNTVKGVEYKRSHFISEELTFDGKKLEGFFRLTEYNKKIYGKARYLEGNKDLLDTLGEGECIIPACLSNKYGIHTGDIISIKYSGGDLSYTVKGVYSDPYNTSIAFDSDILIKSIASNLNTKLQVVLYAKDGVTGGQLEETYREKSNGVLNCEVQTLEDRIDNGLIAANLIGALFLVIGIIILFVSCLIINFMIRNAMVTDAKTIAVYKTIGYSSSDILKMYIKFYYLVVSMACIIGILCSVIISDSVLTSVYKNMGQVVANNVLLPGILCYITIICAVIGLIYVIISKVRNVKPVNALNGMSDSNTKKQRFRGNSKIQFSSFGIALRTIIRSKKGVIGIIITSAVTIFSVNFAIISLDVAYTMKDNNDYWLGVDKCDVMIGISDSKGYNAVQKVIEEDKRIKFYLRNKMGGKVTLKWKKGMNTTSMQAFIYDDFSQSQMPVVKGRNPKAENEIALSGKMAKAFNKDVGDYIEIFLGGQKRVDLLITGIFQTYFNLGDACRINSSVYTKSGMDPKYDNFSIYLKNMQEKEQFINDMKKLTEGRGNVIPRTEALAGIMEMITKPQENAIPPVAVLILLVGGINIFCIVMLKNADSEKTNGIYKCLGYTTWHLISSNVYYVAIIAGASIAVAVPLIIILYPNIMKFSLTMFGFLEYPVSYNLGHIILTNLAVAATFIISTIISSRSLKRVNVRDLVQE
jgi:putative ABC transport system permease protein